MLLRWILNALLAYALFRFVRGLFRVRPPGMPGRNASPRLDPDRAVRASWSEVREESEGERED